MKKFGLLIVAGIAIMLFGCSFNNNMDMDKIPDTLIEEEEIVFNDDNDKSHDSTQKPSINQMGNYDAIINGYTKDWKMNYTITKKDLNLIDDSCSTIIVKGGGSHTSYSNTFKKSEIKVGKTIKLNGTYKFDDSKLQLTDDEKRVLNKKGWNIIPGDRYENYYMLNYSEDNAEYKADKSSEEWIELYAKIGGAKKEYERYPANTILITNDLLLHSFHKLFDNTLKYYEQTTARTTIKELSNKLFEKFVILAENEADSNVKETYEFLAAYWSVPAIILVNENMFEKNGGSDYGLRNTNNDEEIKNIIKSNEETYISKLSPTYQEEIPKIIDEILSANSLEDYDPFLYSFSPKFILKNKIKQDYTQFMPRSHYTDNAELKTYFMAMKWLMREKFYFKDKNLTNAALVMVSNISDEDTAKLGELSAKIKKLIGGDDDLTLESLTSWMKENNINSIEKIKELTKEQRGELLALVPQKIQSSAYERNTQIEGKISADDARNMTDGFVFFGEKFTLDSYLFDLVTAGSAEFEFEVMPKKQTAMIIPDILEGNGDASKIVDLWLKEGVEREKRLNDKQHILEDNKHTQYSSYNKVKQEAKEKIDKEINESSVMNSIYHKWLNMIGLLINNTEENAPYFKLDPVYQLKNLVTYMGSYTELKHDTLLYVKQASSFGWDNMGLGYNKNCDINVDPPILPVPKGYIEADIDIINSLIELNSEIKLDFKELGENIEKQFLGFDEFLIHMKNILEKQVNNEVISDEDFEYMRTAYDKLSSIVYPFGKDVSQKEMRAALIADIFTSEYKGNVDPLYEAVGRPALMLVMINDINGGRIAIGPVFTHYEFYDSDDVIDAKGSRLNDLQWQAAYDSLTGEKLDNSLSIISKKMIEGLYK